MRGNEFLDKMELVDPAYIEEADQRPGRKPPVWLKWGGLAACLCLVASASVLALTVPDKRGAPPTPNSDSTLAHDSPAVTEAPGGWFWAHTPPEDWASDTYSNLTELLDYLRLHDNHGGAESNDGCKGGLSTTRAAMEGSDTVSWQNTVYQLNHDTAKWVGVYQDGTLIGTVQAPADYLFLSDGRLITVGAEYYSGNELDPVYCVRVNIFGLSDPAHPQKLDAFTQLGDLTACWLAENTLYLLTDDGVCACGYSRFSNLEDYKPQLFHGEEQIPWPEEDIRILGAPTRVSYVAAACIDVNASEVICKRAIYGDIEDVFYGPDWLALAASSTPEPGYTFQDVYTFDGSLTYTGRCHVAEDFGLEKTQTRPEDEEPEPPRPGQRPEIKAVSKAGNIWRIIGTIFLPDGSTWSQDLFAMTFDPETGGTAGACLSLPEAQFYIDDVLWEEDRAIISAGFVRFDPFEQGTRLAFAEFEDTGFGTSIDLFSSDIICDRVTGIENMYSYGSPLGWIRPFIPLSGGWYLRYNGTPNGFDIYDLSDSRNPVCLYKSEGDIPEGCRLDFDYRVLYSGGAASSVAVKLITPRDGDYRQPDYSWCIFSLDEEPPVVPRVSQERYPATGFDPASLAPIEP